MAIHRQRDQASRPARLTVRSDESARVLVRHNRSIPADQDRIIREDPSGILVVEGGPGTGKTAVALHRAAYLATTATLFPGAEASGTDSPRAARVKGDARMAGVLAKAVAGLRQTLAVAVEIKVDGTAYRPAPRICATYA
jgi:Mrp family chromosome partitioning ATPase